MGSTIKVTNPDTGLWLLKTPNATKRLVFCDWTGLPL
jgi:hypothetical protein